VSFAEIPKTLKEATVAVEDKEFYTHEGFSTKGILRSIFEILVHHNMQGGSTLTQQLVKNVLLTREQTLPRKIKEFILAVQIERKYSKDEILQMYLNEVPYGSTTYGIEAAAEYYFNKKAKDLTELESVVLAGFPQSPTQYSPFTGNKDAYKGRAVQVLRRLREDKKITPEDEKSLTSQLDSLQFIGGGEKFKAPHFVNYVRDQLVAQFGQQLVESGGLRVTTTLDLDLQEKTQEIVKTEIEKLAKLKVGNGAAVVLDAKSGEILAMVGSKDYDATESGAKFNAVTQALRQPGSALKPITYAQAFKEGYTPASIIMDVATTFQTHEGEKPYEPKNYDGKFRGPVPIRRALANSINVTAVKTIANVGVKDMLQQAYDMGLTTLEPTAENLSKFGLSATLGGAEVHLLDLAQAFSVFATGGIKNDTQAILKVTDQNGKILYEYKPTPGKRVLSEEVSFLTTSILSDNTARSEVFGTNSALNIPGKSVFVKTGTTDDKRDNWTVGGTQSRIVGVWVGNNDNTPMNPALASGVTGAAPIWNKTIREAIKDLKDEPFVKPANVIEMEIDAFGGGTSRDDQPKKKEFFIKGTEPTGPSPIYQKLKISKSNGKLANDVEIASGAYDEKEYYVFKENDPVSQDGKNRWQLGIDDWIKTQPDPKYHPPTEVSDDRKDNVVMNITEPQDHKKYDDHDVKIAGEAFSLGTIREIIVKVDGNQMDDVHDTNHYDHVFNLNTGPHTIEMTAKDDRGKEATGTVRIGVLTPWDQAVPSTPSPAPTPSP
jgi:1A family penicillin-binding protein